MIPGGGGGGRSFSHSHDAKVLSAFVVDRDWAVGLIQTKISLLTSWNKGATLSDLYA